MMDQADGQTRVLGIKTIPLVVLTKDETPRKVKLIKVLHTFKVDYNLVSNRRLHAHGYYFHGDDNTIRRMNNNSELASAPFIEKGLHKLLLAEPGVHYASQNTPVNVETWHQRLSHIGYRTIPDLQKKVTGVNIRKPTTTTKICAACKEASQRQKPSYTHITRAKRAGELLHTDVVGPISPINHNRTRFIMHGIDDAFRVHFEKYTKEKGEAPRILRAWAAYLENHTKYSVQHIRLNNSKEYTKLGTWALKKGISIEPTVPYLPKMNELAEVSGKMIIAKARSILINTELPKELWPEAVNTAIYLLNRLPTQRLNGGVPIEALDRSLSLKQDRDFRPNLNHLKIFGCTAYIHISKEKRKDSDKFGSQNCQGHLINYKKPESGIYRIWMEDSKKVE